MESLALGPYASGEILGDVTAVVETFVPAVKKVLLHNSTPLHDFSFVIISRVRYSYR